MKISLLTDAPKHNLALMKISSYHKDCGDEVLLNMPLFPADYRYASVLFEKNIKRFHADLFGGPAFDSGADLGGIESFQINDIYFMSSPISLNRRYNVSFVTFC